MSQGSRQTPRQRLAIVVVGGLIAMLVIGGLGATPIYGAPAAQTATLQPGALAMVGNTGGEAVNVRARPGLSQGILGSLPEGTRVVINTGPESADGYRWWQVSSTSIELGWMVENFLVPLANPSASFTPVGSVVAVPSRPAAGAGSAATSTPASSPSVAIATPVVTVAPVGMGASATPVAQATAPPPGQRLGRIAKGALVVVDVGPGEAVNVRQFASTSAAIAGIAYDGTVLTVVDGPVEAEGYRWWLVYFEGVTGFVVESFLKALR